MAGIFGAVLVALLVHDLIARGQVAAGVLAGALWLLLLGAFDLARAIVRKFPARGAASKAK